MSLKEEALDYAEEIGDTMRQIIAHQSITMTLLSYGDFNAARSHLKKAYGMMLQFFDTEDHLRFISHYEYMSRIFNANEQLDSALFYIQKSLTVAEGLGNCIYLPNRYLFLSRVYLKMGKRKAELQAYLDGYNIAKQCAGLDPKTHFVTFSRQLGYINMTKGNYRAALHYFQEADSIYEERAETSREKIYHALQASNIARVYQHWGMLDSAMKYREIAIQRFLNSGLTENNLNIPNQYCYIGMIHREWGDLIRAREFLEK